MSTKHFSKADTTNSAQFPVSKVWHNLVRPQHSNAPSMAHQHGKASRSVDGNFQYWLSAGASEQNVTAATATPQQGLGLGP